MNPAELACRWYGHQLQGFSIRTPRHWDGLEDDKFTISQTCQRCGRVWEQKISGSLAHASCEDYAHGQLDIRLA